MLDAEHAPDLAPVAAPSTTRRGRFRTLGVLIVLAAAVLVLLGQGLLHSLNYFETVDQALGARAKLGTSEFRIEGVVRPQPSRAPTGARTSGSRAPRASASSSTRTARRPSSSRPTSPVVVQGHFTSVTSDTFDADADHGEAHGLLHRRAPARVRAPNGTVR